MHYDERKPDRSRHVGVKVHFLRDLARDGHMKLVKFAGTHMYLMVSLKVCLDRRSRNIGYI